MGYGKVFFFEEAVAEKEENDLSIYADEVISVLAAGDREKVREFSDRVFNAFGKQPVPGKHSGYRYRDHRLLP